MDELSKTMESAGSPTNIMEYVRKLEGIIKHERATFNERLRQDTLLMTAGRFARWTVCGIVLGNIPWFMWWLVGGFK